MAKRDYYDSLGVSRSATADEIKTAYRKLVRKYHPDVTKNDPKSTEKFKEVQQAYDVLGDATKRSNFDQYGHAGPGQGGPGSAEYEEFRRAQEARGNGGRRTWNAGPGVSVEDFDFGAGGGGGADYGSIFDTLFGGGARGAGKRGRAKAPPQRGQDVEYPVTLTFEQAARGTHLPLQINRDGNIETIEVKIPPGVKDGSRIRVKGHGQQTGGEPGDLFIITSVHPHPYFRREGLDVSVDVPVSLYEALLGAKIEVPTLDGKLTMTIPPGTAGGSKLRLKGKGVQRGEEQGDQFVVVKVMMPKPLDEADKEALAKLAEKHPINARADTQWA